MSKDLTHVDIYVHKIQEFFGARTNSITAEFSIQNQRYLSQEKREELMVNSLYIKDNIFAFDILDDICNKISEDIDLVPGRSACNITALKLIVSNALLAVQNQQIGLRISVNDRTFKLKTVGLKATCLVIDKLVRGGYLCKFAGCQADYYDKKTGESRKKNYCTVLKMTPKLMYHFRDKYKSGFKVVTDDHIRVKADGEYLTPEEVQQIKSALMDYDTNRETLCALERLSEGRVKLGGSTKRLSYYLQYQQVNSDVISQRIYSKTDIQSLKQQDRLINIKIDGEEVVELDYGNTHPRIIATLENVIGDMSDPYKTDLVLTRKGEALSPDEQRRILKIILFAVLNASEKTLIKAVISVLNANRTDSNTKIANEVISTIKSANPYLQNYIGADAWRNLQNLDGQITMRVIGQFVGLGEVILPYHDSFIVKKSLKQKLRNAMLVAWKDILGNIEHCKIDEKIADPEGYDALLGDVGMPEFAECMLFSITK